MKLKFASLLLVITFVSCSKVPITGRKQVNLLPESTLMSMSLSSYRDFLSQHPAISTSDENAQMVQRVGQKIAQAVTKFMRQKNMSKRIQGYKWEFNLVNDPAVNAWCMPGGKVVVYSGLLPVTQTETSLACVMGHEIAHAVARHGNERMSQQLLAVAGGIGLDLALSQQPEQTRNIFLTSYGVGSTLGMLKYSRTHETEADKMGLIFMAMAGYNPEESIAFWQRMAQSGGGPKPPEFISTHPSDETRIKEIKAFLPTAKKYYTPQAGS
jgi:predicted Zn-dependent protease